MTVSPEIRLEFFKRLVRGPAEQCWLSSHFARGSKGYPRWTVKRPGGGVDTHDAHRIAYEVFHGPIPDGHHVRHVCSGNAFCLNPAHLATGTPRDNVLDMHEANRARPARGEAHGSAKHSDAQIIEARELYASGLTKREVSERTGISFNTVEEVVQGHAWKHLGGKIERKTVYDRDATGKLIATRYELVCIHAATAPALPEDHNSIGAHPTPLDVDTLTPANIRHMREARAQGMHRADVARMFAVSPSFVREVELGELYPDPHAPKPSRTGPLARSTAPRRDTRTAIDLAQELMATSMITARAADVLGIDIAELVEIVLAGAPPPPSHCAYDPKGIGHRPHDANEHQRRGDVRAKGVGKGHSAGGMGSRMDTGTPTSDTHAHTPHCPNAMHSESAGR